ncbi:PREDICTED: uncharacterized protein LOC107356554 [Acropora digitifera]|uniref:uncharacterized protein LOC107356554 n=1 Tax=Acropora digitifera TaxID=70779 RepID=UPI00077B2433|nr:PREDICTED: uncharacterized protein LOC107356554 [Acropora digitifera]
MYRNLGHRRRRMASVLVDDHSGELNHLFGDISSKFSSMEAAEVVKSSKRIYGEQFEGLQNEDLLSCLNLFFKFGYVSKAKLTLIREFVASKSINEEEIKKIIDNYTQVSTLQIESEKQMQGRDNDITKITGRLKAGQPSIVNLHGSGGVGKTTLAKEICVKWPGKSHIFDLREAKDMRAVYLKVMNMFGLAVPVGYIDSSSLVKKMLEQAFMKSEGVPVLFLLDNADLFTLGEGKEGKNLKTAFMQFLGKLTRYNEEMSKTRELRILLTSRTCVKEASKVEDYELQPLKDNFSEKILRSNKTADINAEQLKKFHFACSGKPLLLQGLRAICKQGRKLPGDLVNELEKYMQSAKDKGETPVRSKGDEDPEENAFKFEDEEVGETFVLHEMFNTLPSESLKASAVSISLFRGPFSAATAAVILGTSLPEAVAQLEGLETSAIISVENREAKELLYYIHPLLKKYPESIKNDEKFLESYTEARKRFCDHFMSQMLTIAGFVDSNFLKAFNMFSSDDANYKFAIELSMEPEFFSVSSEYRENTLIMSLVNTMLSSEERRELLKAWASLCEVDTETGSLFHAHLKCWEAMIVLDLNGPKEAFEVLQEAAHSLEKLQDKTVTNFKLTQGLYFYSEGEIFCRARDYKRALQRLQLCVHNTKELPEVNIQLARCYNAMGNCHYHGLEDYNKALEFYSKAIRMTAEISGSSEYHYNLPLYKNQIGTVYEGQGNYAKAVEYYKEAIRLLEELKISGGPDEAHFQKNLANAYLYQNNFKEAVEPAERAFEIRKKHLGDHPDTVRSIFQQGVVQAYLKESEKALDLFKKAWEMEKSLQLANHSVVWKQIIERIILCTKDYNQKKKFEKEALAFCQRLWKEEKEISTFGFNKSTKEIIDTLMQFLRNGERDESTIYEYEKEELWFYDGFHSSTEQDFWGEFDVETDSSGLNVMICGRMEIINKILDLCDRLDQHEMRAKYQRIKLTIYRKVLLKPNFVGKKGNEKETIIKAVEQLYTELGEGERIAEFLESLLSSWIVHWEQRGGGADASEMSSLGREGTIRGILQLCKDLNKKKLYRRFGKEAVIFFEDLWTEKFKEMDTRKTKRLLREMKDLASSVQDFERERLYQDVYQTFLNTGEKPATLRHQEGEVANEEEEEEIEGQSASEEEEIEIRFEDDTVEQLEEEDEVVLTSEGESEMASEDENEFLRYFSDTNCETIVFPPGALSGGRISTVPWWNSRFRPPPLLENEAVVSDVIELSLDSPGQHFDKAVTLVIPHCASDLKGYEVVVKSLSIGDEWKDVETDDWRTKDDIKEDYDLSGYVSDFPFPVAACKVTQCSAFAVVCRLKSHRHVVTSQESELVWPEFPLAKVSFPQNAVPPEESFEVTAKLQEVSQRPFRQGQILPGPILRITSSKSVNFLQPVAVQLPLSLSEPHRKVIAMSVVRVRILSSPENRGWIEITEKLGTRFDGNVISFSVSQFSDFWIWVDWGTFPLSRYANTLDTDSVPMEPLFAVPRDICLHGEGCSRFRLTLIARTYQLDNDKKKQGNVNRGRFQEHSCQDDTPCELNVTLPPRNYTDKTPVEFFGLPFDDVILHEAPFEGPYGILTACIGVLRDIRQGRIYDYHKDLVSKRPEREVKKSFLMELSRLDLEHKQRCFNAIVNSLKKGGEGLKRIRDHLIKAQRKISARITKRVRAVVADRFKDLGTSWKTLARDLQPEIKDGVIDAIETEERRCPKECCRAVLREWYQRHTRRAKSKELMRCLTNMGLANVNWQIMRELGLVKLKNIPLSER